MTHQDRTPTLRWLRGLTLLGTVLTLSGADCAETAIASTAASLCEQALRAFSFGALPSALTAAQGSTASPVAVTVTRPEATQSASTCRNKPVEVRAEGLPAGVTAAITSPGAGNSGSVTLTVGSQATPGRTVVSLAFTTQVREFGLDSVLTRVPLDLTVTEAPGFSLTASAAGQSVAQGATGPAVGVTVARRGSYAGGITVVVDGLPAGVTAAITSPGTGTSGSLALSVGAQVAANRYPLTIRATGAGVSPQTVPFELTVTQPPGFTAGVDPTGITVLRGASGTATLSVTRTGGFAGAISTAVTGTPAGVSVTGGSIGTGTSAVVTFQVPASAPLGVAVLEFALSAPGLPTRTVPFALLIADPPGFTLAAATASQLVEQGATGSPVGVTVTRRGGFAGAVTLAVDGLPTGVTATVTSPGSGTSGSLAFTVGAQAAPGQYPITMRATAAGVAEQSLPFALIVSAPVARLFLSGPVSINPTVGGTVESTVSIARSGWSGAVSFEVTGAPAHTSATMVPTSTTGNSAVLRVQLGTLAEVGSYPLVIRATGANGTSATLTVTMQVSR